MERMNSGAEYRNEGSDYLVNNMAWNSEMAGIEPRTAKIKQALPYAAIPFICAALLFVRGGGTDPFVLIKLEFISVIGFVIAIIDLKTKRIPNNLVLLMLMVWTLVMIPQLFIDTGAAIVMFIDSILGFATGGGIFLLVYLVNKEGLGGGDVKFMAAAGAYLGFRGTLPTVLFGSIIAALTGSALILLKKMGRYDTMPLAPFLYIGMLITIFLQ